FRFETSFDFIWMSFSLDEWSFHEVIGIDWFLSGSLGGGDFLLRKLRGWCFRYLRLFVSLGRFGVVGDIASRGNKVVGLVALGRDRRLVQQDPLLLLFLLLL